MTYSPNRAPRHDPIDLIIVHSSVGSFGSSLGWLTNPASGVSSHYLVSPAGDIAFIVPEEDIAWHAGVSFWQGRSNLNRYSIGIELANRGGMKGIPAEPYPAVQLQTAAALIADICRRRTINPDRNHIVSHADVAPGRKHDPIALDMNTLRALVAPQYDHPLQDVWYIVPSRVNVRQGPSTSFPIAGQLSRGTALRIDAFVKGEKLSGSDQWAHLSVDNPCRDLGFVHSRLLRQ